MNSYERARRIALCIRDSDWSGVSGHVEQAHTQKMSVHCYLVAGDLPGTSRVALRVARENELSAGIAEVGIYDAAKAQELAKRMGQYGIEWMEVRL